MPKLSPGTMWLLCRQGWEYPVLPLCLCSGSPSLPVPTLPTRQELCVVRAVAEKKGALQDLDYEPRSTTLCLTDLEKILTGTGWK